MKRLLPLLLLFPFFCGCYYSFEITNLDAYQAGPPDHQYQDLTIQLKQSATNNQAEQRLIQETARALHELGGYTILTTSTSRRHSADLSVRLSILSWEKNGKIENLLVCFPGFFIFAHAWLGYDYESNFKVRCDLVETESETPLETFDVDLPMDICQADFDRCWANVTGLLTLSSIFPIVNGVVCTTFDPDLEETVYKEAFPLLGDKLGTILVEKINALPWEENTEYDY